MSGVARGARLKLCRSLVVAASFAVLAAIPAESNATAPAPSLYLPRCPGVSEPLLTSSFPPGTYDLSSDYATFDPTTLTVRTDGTTTKVTATVENDAPTTFEVDAAPRSGGAAPYAFQWRLNGATLGYNLNEGAYAFTGGCFGPGDTIDISVDSPNAAAPSSVIADRNGEIAVEPTVTARGSRTTLTVSATDTASGRTATGTFPVPATTLATGAQLSSADVYAYQMLYSPDLSYQLAQNGCTTDLQHFYVAHGVTYSPWTWWVVTGTHARACRLRLLSTGDLVLRAAATGKRIWHTGTATTGSNNRLVVQNNGNVVLRTGTGHPVWSSKTGLIRGRHGYVTHAAITPTGSGDRVDITGVVRQYTINGTLVPGAGRVVNLESKIGARWHVDRTKTADSTGHVTFGFLQTPARLYRLAVSPTGRLAAAFSRIVRR